MQAHVTAEQRPQTILVVESDETTRLILDLSLRQAGFLVGLASDGVEGARRLVDKPDLVIAAADRSRRSGLLPSSEAGRQRHAAGGGADLRLRCREQAARARGRRRRFLGATDLRAGGGGPRARAAAAARARAARGRGAGERSLRHHDRRRPADRSPPRNRGEPEVGRRPADRRRGIARRALLSPGARGRRRGRAPVRARRRLPAVLLDLGSARGRVEEHPAQRHHRDGAAGSFDGRPSPGRRLAAPGGGASAARRDLRRSTTACSPSGSPTSPTR